MAGCLGGPWKDGKCRCTGHLLIERQSAEADARRAAEEAEREFDVALLRSFIGAAFAGRAQGYRRDGVMDALRRIAG